MRQFFFSNAFLLVGFCKHATILTVSNTPFILAPFNTMQVAVDASRSGDTI